MPAAAVPLVISTGSALMQNIGQRQAAKQQNQWMSNMYSPSNVMSRAQGLNPELFGALAGQAGTTPYQYNLWKLASNPGYIDPTLMNASYLQSAQQQQQDLMRVQQMLGRSDMGGTTGVGNFYALANQAARTGRDVQLGQQYALAREQQRRADLDWLTNQANTARSGAMGLVNQQAGTYQQPPTWGQIAGNMGAAGLTAYGSLPRPTSQGQSAPYGQPSQSSWAMYPSYPNYVERNQSNPAQFWPANNYSNYYTQ